MFPRKNRNVPKFKPKYKKQTRKGKPTWPNIKKKTQRANLKTPYLKPLKSKPLKKNLTGNNRMDFKDKGSCLQLSFFF